MSDARRIIDPKADEAVQRAMAAAQQSIQIALMQIEHRDQFAMALLPIARLEVLRPGPTDLRALVVKAYEMADLMLKVRQEKPSDPQVSTES
jgi:hypothetical protein